MSNWYWNHMESMSVLLEWCRIPENLMWGFNVLWGLAEEQANLQILVSLDNMYGTATSQLGIGLCLLYDYLVRAFGKGFKLCRPSKDIRYRSVIVYYTGWVDVRYMSCSSLAFKIETLMTIILIILFIKGYYLK